MAGFGLASGRVPGRSGVWLPADGSRPERKIVAVGIRVSRGTTQHGFGFNVSNDLGSFGRIIPCGITDAGVTSLDAELGTALSVAEAATAVEPHLRELLTFD